MRGQYNSNQKNADNGAIACQKWLRHAFEGGGLYNTFSGIYVVSRQAVYVGNDIWPGPFDDKCNMEFDGFLGKKECSKDRCWQWEIEGDNLVNYSSGSHDNFSGVRRWDEPVKTSEYHYKSLHRHFWIKRYGK